jgi:hypothetical protein
MPTEYTVKGFQMAWQIASGPLGGLLDGQNPNPPGARLDTRRTEQEALDYAKSLIRRNIGVRWIWEDGTETPKYETEVLVAMVNAEISTP